MGPERNTFVVSENGYGSKGVTDGQGPHMTDHVTDVDHRRVKNRDRLDVDITRPQSVVHSTYHQPFTVDTQTRVKDEVVKNPSVDPVSCVKNSH